MWANSRMFSDRNLADLLSNGSNTTGIFSNLARGLTTMDVSHVEFTGDDNLGEEAVYRHTFRVSPQAGAWQIQTHSQNGTDKGRLGKRARSG